MAIYVPTSVINSEEQQTVSRASIRRMIQGGQGIVPAANATEQAQALANATSAGISPTAANPLFVYRSDTGTLRVYDGSQWRDLTSDGALLTSAFGSTGTDIGVPIGGAVNGASVTFTNTYPVVDVAVSANFLRADGAAAGNVKIVVDGTENPSVRRILAPSGSAAWRTYAPEWHWKLNLTPGSHTVVARIMADSASGNAIYLTASRIEVHHN